MTVSAAEAFTLFRRARWNEVLPEDALLQADTSSWRPFERHQRDMEAERIAALDKDEFAAWLFQLRNDVVIDGTLARRPAFPVYLRRGDQDLQELDDENSLEALSTWQFTESDYLATPLGGDWQTLAGATIEVDPTGLREWLAHYRRAAETHEIYQTHADTAALDLLIELVRAGSLRLGHANEIRARWGLPPMPPEAIRFDPMEVERWSLPMIQAWILSRSPYEVMVHSATYRELVGLRPLSPFWGAETIKQIKEQAERELAGLEFGALATGETRRRVLAREEWAGLKFLSSPDDAVDLWGYREGQVAFETLEVARQGVLRCWPSANCSALASEVRPNKATGLPGRPTSKSLFLAEFDRRAASNSILPSLAEEARYLAEFVNSQPDWPSVTQKTVENAIRDAYRAARAAP